MTRDEFVKRLAPTSETVRRLYLLSGNQCAFPECTHPIIINNGTYVGELCHICAAEKGGERFDPAQSNEDRRHFDNLMLMCHNHHVLTNDVTEYPVERMRQIKADHEGRFESGLATMIDSVSVQISESMISLGGEGGKAPGAGGGGGGAIGANSRGGRGGDGGGQFLISDTGEKHPIDLDSPLTPRWAKDFIDSTHKFLVGNPGAGGGGQNAIGNSARGGDGGQGGENVVGRFKLPPGEYRIEVGKGGISGELPGQHGLPGGQSRIIAPDGTMLAEAMGGQRTRNASSYLPDGVEELSKSYVESGFNIAVFSPCTSLEISRGLIFASELGWEYYDVPHVPIEAIWSIACSIQLPAQRNEIGFYVALLNPLGEEVSCQAVTIPHECLTYHFGIPIGALFDRIGAWKLIAHSGGYLLAEYIVYLRIK